jgi:hypothetical protein
MPNWTYNSIRVEGSKDSLTKFMTDGLANAHKPENEGDNPQLSLSSWIPTPETFLKYDTTNHPNGKGLKVGDKWWDGLGPHGDKVVTEELIEEFKQATKEQAEKYGVVGWYDYNVKTFGCKWDSEVRVENINDTEINLSADTPWSAPDKWLRTISEKYPELTFHLHALYEEGFWEDLDYKEGRKAEIDSGEYDWEEDEM